MPKVIKKKVISFCIFQMAFGGWSSSWPRGSTANEDPFLNRTQTQKAASLRHGSSTLKRGELLLIHPTWRELRVRNDFLISGLFRMKRIKQGAATLPWMATIAAL